jgi:hypothetical protein
MFRTGITAVAYLALLIVFGAFAGTFVMSGCGGGQEGSPTPDVAAQLETRARDAARGATEPGSEELDAGDGPAHAQDDAPAHARDELADESEGLPGASQADGTNCLELLDEGAYAEAIAACSEALARNPGDERLKNALATARGEVAEAEAGAAREAADALQGMR